MALLDGGSPILPPPYRQKNVFHCAATESFNTTGVASEGPQSMRLVWSSIAIRVRQCWAAHQRRHVTGHGCVCALFFSSNVISDNWHVSSCTGGKIAVCFKYFEVFCQL
jgi:hypothetical protein